MADWVTISSLGTAGGTLLLAVATYQSVLSSNRSARVAERSLLEGVRPVLIPSRDSDPDQRVGFGDLVVLTVPGHGAAAEVRDDVVYLAVALRNGGAGLAVLHGWRAREAGQRPGDVGRRGEMLLEERDRLDGDRQVIAVDERPDLAEFRRQQLDLFIAAGETGFWQGALRDPEEPGYREVRDAVLADEPLWIDLLYGDYEGGQRTIVRTRIARLDGEDDRRLSTLRYWNLDRDDPR